jgi:hypothetical protein
MSFIIEHRLENSVIERRLKNSLTASRRRLRFGRSKLSDAAERLTIRH